MHIIYKCYKYTPENMINTTQTTDIYVTSHSMFVHYTSHHLVIVLLFLAQTHKLRGLTANDRSHRQQSQKELEYLQRENEKID